MTATTICATCQRVVFVTDVDIKGRCVLCSPMRPGARTPPTESDVETAVRRVKARGDRSPANESDESGD